MLVFHRRVIVRPNPAPIAAFYLHDRERIAPNGARVRAAGVVFVLRQ
jgi:hypothetical protein